MSGVSCREYQDAIERRFLDRRSKIEARNAKFVHYTSSFVARSIVLNDRIWMRNASLMNDFSEIEWGLERLKEVWPDDRVQGPLDDILDKISEDYSKSIKRKFYKDIVPNLLLNSFILSLSEHAGDDSEGEDLYGRLSMWRAYGGDKNVALVINPDFAFNSFWGTKVFFLPVEYSDSQKFECDFLEVCELIKEFAPLADLSVPIGSDDFAKYLLWWLQMIVLSTKHPGFSEEKEWRAIYLPDSFPEDFMRSEIEFSDGLPQEVYMISTLHDDQTSALTEIIDEVLIGPTQFPEIMRKAMVRLLDDAGFTNAGVKVKVSNIPLRR